MRQPLRIAMLASWADLRATCHRIPGRVGPFNARPLGHSYFLQQIKLRRAVSLGFSPEGSTTLVPAEESKSIEWEVFLG
ncbi:protein of unknown function [Candidatus Methylomirabilis oxygeniifera]|uniref:Uncharacterized protein n=1 Tax=Methylomirabilis oxygeniifera TaxID=671143 RepID=D5MF27_METO1|nr:protein of unknown function [Candidatus Methylomirabilis oxyfera]